MLIRKCKVRSKATLCCNNRNFQLPPEFLSWARQLLTLRLNNWVSFIRLGLQLCAVTFVVIITREKS